MKEIICDICGRRIKGTYSCINLPFMHGGEVMQYYDPDDALDVCRPCALELYDLIEKFKEEKREVL